MLESKMELNPLIKELNYARRFPRDIFGDEIDSAKYISDISSVMDIVLSRMDKENFISRDYKGLDSTTMRKMIALYDFDCMDLGTILAYNPERLDKIVEADMDFMGWNALEEILWDIISESGEYFWEENDTNALENNVRNVLPRVSKLVRQKNTFIKKNKQVNGNEELKNSKPGSKFIASLVTHHNDVYSYSSDIEVILDTYSDKYLKYGNQSLKKLTEELDQDDSFIPMTNVYTSEKLSNIVFVVLEQFVKNSSLPIKQCQYCNRYFIPKIRQDEIYCDLPNEDGNSCREKGAKQTYKQNLEKIPALLEYRKAYQKKFMEVARSDNNKQLKKCFDSWKKIAQGKIKDYKQGKITED